MRAIKQLFRRGTLLGLRMTMLAIFSLFLMFLDQRISYVRHAGAKISVIAVPFQYLVNSPIQFFGWLSSSISTQHQLLEENARLRAQQLLLQAKLQQVLALENENAQLRALLQSSPHVGGRFTVSQLLAVSMDPAVQKMVLDKGMGDKIYVGQPVLDAYGVMGQVVDVGPTTSQVLLVTDIQNAIPVQNSRNGIRAIAIGMGYNGKIQLVNVPDTTDVQAGDVFVTSGLEQRYPPGFPVGMVKSVTRDPEYRFATIILDPSAHLNRSRQVLLVWPNPVAVPTTSSADAAKKVEVKNPGETQEKPRATEHE